MSSSGISAKKWKNIIRTKIQIAPTVSPTLNCSNLSRIFSRFWYSKDLSCPLHSPPGHPDHAGERALRAGSHLLPRQASRDSASRIALSHTEDTLLSFCQSSLSAGALHPFSVCLSASAPRFGGLATSPSPTELSSFSLCRRALGFTLLQPQSHSGSEASSSSCGFSALASSLGTASRGPERFPGVGF